MWVYLYVLWSASSKRGRCMAGCDDCWPSKGAIHFNGLQYPPTVYDNQTASLLTLRLCRARSGRTDVWVRQQRGASTPTSIDETCWETVDHAAAANCQPFLYPFRSGNIPALLKRSIRNILAGQTLYAYQPSHTVVKHREVCRVHQSYSIGKADRIPAHFIL